MALFFAVAELSSGPDANSGKSISGSGQASRQGAGNFCGFHLGRLSFRAAVREGIDAADRGEVVPLEEVKKMIPQWASK